MIKQLQCVILYHIAANQHNHLCSELFKLIVKRVLSKQFVMTT